MERKKKPRANTISAMVAAAGGNPKDHFVDENDWSEVIDYAKTLGVTPKEIFDYTQKTRGNTYKTKTSTMRIGCLIYDTLKKKSKLSTRSRIINLRKKIEVIEPKYKKFSDQKLYENANHAHKRTPSFVLWDSDVREDLF
jgi:hypothetical protein